MLVFCYETVCTNDLRVPKGTLPSARNHEKRHLRMSFFSYICSLRNKWYLLCKWYCPSGSDIRLRRAKGTNIISLKPKVSISLLIYQKYHSIEEGISLKYRASIMNVKSKNISTCQSAGACFLLCSWMSQRPEGSRRGRCRALAVRDEARHKEGQRSKK